MTDQMLSPVEPTVAPEVTLEGPEFEARKHVDPAKLPGLEQYAAGLMKRPDFDALFFVRMSEDVGSQVPTLDRLLELAQARKTGDVGKRVIDSKRRMTKMSSQMPTLPEGFVDAYNKGRAGIEKAVKVIISVSRQIEDALELFQDLKTLIDADAHYIDSQAEVMIEAVIDATKAAKEQDGRTKELLGTAAMLEFLLDMIKARLDEVADGLTKNPDDEALKDEQQKWSSIVMLVTKRLGSFKPLIQMGVTNEQDFLNIRNTDAVAALTLKDVAGPGMAQYKTDVVKQLMYMQSEISMFVAQVGIDMINNEAGFAAEAGAKHMKLFSQLMANLIVSVQTVERASKASVDAHEASTQALENAIETGKIASRAVEKGRNEVATAERKSLDELRKLLR